nr:hypothetical protein [Prevotella sp.]
TFATTMTLSAQAQTVDTLTIESVYGTSYNFSIPPHNIKALQTSSRKGGVVDLNLQAGMSEEWRQSILVAAGYWERYLPCDTLKLHVYYSNLGNVDMITNILYYSDPSEGYCCPMSLKHSQIRLNHEAPLASGYPLHDADITINSWVVWNMGIGECEGKNLTYAFMQAIGHALGFSSSLKYKKGNVRFGSTGCKSDFDNQVYSSSSTWMKDVQEDSLQNYAEPSCGYLYITDNAYKLYAPTPFDQNTSLRYFYDSGSLMSFTDSSNKTLTVDNVTRQVLNAIGWDMELDEPDVTIACSGVDSTGIMSAYTSHTFSVTSNTGTVSNWHWEATLPLANGSEQTLTGTSATFTLPALSNEQQYARTVEGDVKCLVRFTGTVAGDSVNAEYWATLELKPVILSTNILAITRSNIDGRYKNVTVGVRYAGSHYAYLELEEESNPYLSWYYSDVPYYTTYTFEDIYSLESAWLNVTVRNAYGNAYSTITVFEGPTQSRAFTSIDSPTGSIVEEGYDVFTVDGKHLGHVQNVYDLKQGGYALGIYLLKAIRDGKCVTKIIKI